MFISWNFVAFKSRCAIFMDIFWHPWPQELYCDTFPDKDDPNVCLGYKEARETPVREGYSFTLCKLLLLLLLLLLLGVFIIISRPLTDAFRSNLMNTINVLLVTFLYFFKYICN